MRSIRKSLLHSCIALVLAFNYFAFQVELFEEEYEANHPRQAETCSFSKPTLTWESFDKDNAPKAFVVNPYIQLACFFILPLPHIVELRLEPPFQPVRDKSPPYTSSSPIQVSIV